MRMNLQRFLTEVRIREFRNHNDSVRAFLQNNRLSYHQRLNAIHEELVEEAYRFVI